MMENCLSRMPHPAFWVAVQWLILQSHKISAHSRNLKESGLRLNVAGNYLFCTCSKIFESVLDAWCMLPGGSEMPKEVQDFVSDAFSLLFEAPPMQKENSFKNRDHIDLSVDHQLSKLYRQAMKAVQAIVLGDLGGGNC